MWPFVFQFSSWIQFYINFAHVFVFIKSLSFWLSGIALWFWFATFFQWIFHDIQSDKFTTYLKRKATMTIRFPRTVRADKDEQAMSKYNFLLSSFSSSEWSNVSSSLEFFTKKGTESFIFTLKFYLLVHELYNWGI